MSPPTAIPACRETPASRPSTVQMIPFWLLLALMVGFAVREGFTAKPFGSHAADFAIFRTAAELLKRGSSAALYEIDAQQRAFRDVTGGRDFLVWNHHPFEALLYRPAAAVSYDTGLRLAQVFNAFCLAMIAFWAANRVGRDPRRLLFLSVVFFCGTPFLGSAISMGQDSLWVMAILIAALRRLSESRPWPAALLLGLASVKFTVVLPLIGLLWLAGYRRVSWYGLAATCSLALMTLFLLGWEVIASYVRFCIELLHVNGKWGLYSMFLVNFRGILQLLRTPPALALGLTAAALVLYARIVRRVTPERLPGFALFGAAAFSPHLYPHDAALYCGAAVLLVVGAAPLRASLASKSHQ